MITALMAVCDTPERMLDRAIESIRSQTLEDWEFLVIDDGSQSPAVRDCLARHAAFDARIRVVRLPHGGLTSALNAGLELARGEWIARQDADDWSEQERFERQIGYLAARAERGLCGTAAWTHREDGKSWWPVAMPLSHDEILRAFERGNPFVHGSTMFRLEAARAVGGYREGFPCSQDYDFFWRLSETVQAANLAEPLYHYRYTRGAVSASRAREQACVHSAARHLARARRLGQSENVDAALLHAAADRDGGELRAALKQADHTMLAGDGKGSARAYWHLATAHPGSRLAWGKLLRWAVFAALPPLRERCFR